MKKHTLTALLFLVIISLKAQHTITREKFSIVITYYTLYSGEDYMLYVDLGKAVNAEVKHGGMTLPIDVSNRAKLKFKALASTYEKDENSNQSIHLTIKINHKVFTEDISFVVKKIPIKEYSKQDSVCIFLSENEAYKKVKTFDNVFIYDDFIKYLKKKLPLESNVGQLSIVLMINSEGHVVRYDCMKNSYTGITKEEFDKIIMSYSVVSYMLIMREFKFVIEVFSFQGHPDPIFYGNGFIIK